MFYLFVLVLFAVTTYGQRFAPGPCPKYIPKFEFDKSKFYGHWIEVEKSASIFDLMMRCLTVDYSEDNDGTMNVVVRGVSLAGLPLNINGDGIMQDTSKGYYSVRYVFGVPFQGTLTSVIDTDYNEYSVVYSCTNSLINGLFHTEYLWILSRDGTLPNPTRQNIYEKLDEMKINRSGLQITDRAACPIISPNGTFITREESHDDPFLKTPKPFESTTIV